MLEEKTGGTLTKVYAYGLDLISQRTISGNVLNYYGYDGNGNTRLLTGTTLNNYRYTGEQFDPNLGFYYLRARYMNPNSGRFLSRDSYAGNIYDPASLHRYTYCANSPVNYADPSGHDLGTVLVVFVTIGILVAIGIAVYPDYEQGKIDRQVRKVSQAEIRAELAREPFRQTALEDIIGTGGKKKFREAGLVVGGRMSVRFQSEAGGQPLRNLWEDPNFFASHATAIGELSARVFGATGSSRDLIYMMAHEDEMIDEGRQAVAEALLVRHQAYERWLCNFLQNSQ